MASDRERFPRRVSYIREHTTFPVPRIYAPPLQITPGKDLCDDERAEERPFVIEGNIIPEFPDVRRANHSIVLTHSDPAGRNIIGLHDSIVSIISWSMLDSTVSITS